MLAWRCQRRSLRTSPDGCQLAYASRRQLGRVGVEAGTAAARLVRSQRRASGARQWHSLQAPTGPFGNFRRSQQRPRPKNQVFWAGSDLPGSVPVPRMRGGQPARPLAQITEAPRSPLGWSDADCTEQLFQNLTGSVHRLARAPERLRGTLWVCGHRAGVKKPVRGAPSA